jgi:hypothetical protein
MVGKVSVMKIELTKHELTFLVGAIKKRKGLCTKGQQKEISMCNQLIKKLTIEQTPMMFKCNKCDRLFYSERNSAHLFSYHESNGKLCLNGILEPFTDAEA